MTPDLLSRSLKLLRQRQVLIWLGLGMSLSGLFGLGWRIWLSQVSTITFDFKDIQSIESLLFNSELVRVQQLLLQGLLLAFGQFVLVWLVALMAEAGLISSILHQASGPVSLRQVARWGQQWLGRFLAVDLLVFFPWFLIALTMLLVILVLSLLLAGFATRDVGAGTVLATTGLGLACMLGLTGLLLPVGLGSLWYRLLAFREMILHDLSPRTAVRQTWQRIKANLGDVFVLIIILWGGQTLFLTVFNFITSPVLGWLTAFTTSDRIALQAIAWLVVVVMTLVVWLVRGLVTAYVAIAWTLAYQDLNATKN